MPNEVPNAHLLRVLDAYYGGKTFRLRLTNGYVMNGDTHGTMADVTGELSGGGYPVNGLPVTITTSVDPATNQVIATHAAVNFTGLTGTVDGAVITEDAGNPATDPVIKQITFTSRTLAGDPLTIGQGTLTTTNNATDD